MIRLESLSLDSDSRILYHQFVPEYHPLRQLAESLDFSFILPLVAHRYNHWIGSPAKHPELMWRMLFAQSFLNLSDRKIWLQAHSDLALRLFLRLGKSQKVPHWTTLQKFRFKRLDQWAYLAIHFMLLEQAERKGLLDREERQIFDSTHMRSNTRVVSIAMLLLQARERVIKEVKLVDPAFGALLEAQALEERQAYREERKKRQEQGLPKLTKEEKAAAVIEVVTKTLVAVRARIAARLLEATERINVWVTVLAKVIADRTKGATDRIVSVFDLEARKGRKGSGQWGGRKTGINMQEKSRFVMAVEVVPGNENDYGLVEPLLDEQKEGFDLTPPELTADKGADSGPVRSAVRRREIVAHIPVGERINTEDANLFKVADFTFDPFKMMLICPAGETTKVWSWQDVQTRQGVNFTFRKLACRRCPLAEQCHRADTTKRGRVVFISIYHHAYEQARKHNETAEFEEAYGHRGRVEAKIWELVYHGTRRCRCRGNDRSWSQVIVTVVVVNGKRLNKLHRQREGLEPLPKPTRRAA